MIYHVPRSYSKHFSRVCLAVVLVLFTSSRSHTATVNYSPQFDRASSYSSIISGNNDLADIYYPDLTDINSGKYSFPIVLFLQGALVDKSFYSDYASLVARYGFIVAVPNHYRPFPTNPNSPPSLLAETSQVGALVSQMAIENTRPESPIAGAVDTQKLGLMGHSFGAAVGLSVIANQCLNFLCSEPFTRPKELLAGVFYGANLRDQVTNQFIPIANDGIGVALIQGDRDGVALPERAKQTFENIQTPPKALITLTGANHFGITNINNPLGAVPDPISPTLSQSVAVETIARWSGLFLRSSLLKDPTATDYIYVSGDQLDPNVQVRSEAVPEPSSVAGILVIGLFGLTYRWKKRKIS